MDLIELSIYLLDEKAAEEYLIEKGVIKTFAKCIRCESEKLGKIRRGKIKCYDCKYEWKQTKGSILEECRISASKFLGLLKLFELEIPVYKAAKIIRLNKRTVLKFYGIIRKRITEIDDYGIKNFGTKDFMIVEKNGKISIAPISENKSNYELNISRVRNELGEIRFIGKINKNHLVLNLGNREKLSTDLIRLVKNVNNKLSRTTNIHKNEIFAYLKEIEFRFNNQNKCLFESLIKIF